MKKVGLLIPLLLGILTRCVTTSETKQYDFSFSSIGDGESLMQIMKMEHIKTKLQ